MYLVNILIYCCWRLDVNIICFGVDRIKMVNVSIIIELFILVDLDVVLFNVVDFVFVLVFDKIVVNVLRFKNSND